MLIDNTTGAPLITEPRRRADRKWIDHGEYPYFSFRNNEGGRAPLVYKVLICDKPVYVGKTTNGARRTWAHCNPDNVPSDMVKHYDSIHYWQCVDKNDMNLTEHFLTWYYTELGYSLQNVNLKKYDSKFSEHFYKEFEFLTEIGFFPRTLKT